MSASCALAADRLTGFPAALREAGLPVDPTRAITFLAAVSRCDLHSVDDLARIGKVTLVGAPDHFSLYDDVFESWFGDGPGVAGAPSDEEEMAPPRNRPSARDVPPLLAEGGGAGKAASDDHLRNTRAFARLADADALARLRRRFAALPTMRSRMWKPAPLGPRIDVERTARAARKTFGETLRLMEKARPERPRRLLLLIDVSGSMKAHSETYLRFAHLATRRRGKVETFTFGTRLSRVTAALKHRDGDTALARLGQAVPDFDGGTLIGASLGEFLSVSRHAALVRGAVTLVFSDGLERGDPARMINAAARLARLSHRLVWVTPLAADPRYRPATRAMSAILPCLDAIFDGDGFGALERMLKGLAQVETGPRGQAARRFSGGVAA